MNKKNKISFLITVFLIISIVIVGIILFIYKYNEPKKSESNDNLGEYLSSKLSFDFLKGFEIIDVDWNYFIDKDGTLYDIVKDKNNVFENGEKYKIREEESLKIKSKIKHLQILLGEDGFVYKTSREIYKEGYEIGYNFYLSNRGKIELEFLQNDKIIDVAHFSETKTYDGTETYLVLYNDGSVYKRRYKVDYSNYGSTYTLIEDNLHNLNSENVSYVKAIASEWVLTNDGLYVLHNKNENCEDCRNDYYYKKCEKFDTIENDILYNDLNIVVFKNYKVVSFQELYNEFLKL